MDEICFVTASLNIVLAKIHAFLLVPVLSSISHRIVVLKA